MQSVYIGHVSMISDTFKICCLTGAFILGLALNANPALAENTSELNLENTIKELELKLDARIGVLIRDAGSVWQWRYREDERFLMASTFKSVLCGAVLDKVDQGTLTLDEPIGISAQDILSYAPVTKNYIGRSLSIGDLCLATLDKSDNTAANLLIERLGGTQEITAYLRRIGDPVTRLDRMEPDLNIFAPGDPRDTTSPAAILLTWQAMLLGNGLEPGSRKILAQWMSYGGVTGALIRASTPEGWQVADKSGGGRDHTRALVAMITPPESAPFFVAIYVSDTLADWASRNAAIAEIGTSVIEVIKNRK